MRRIAAAIALSFCSLDLAAAVTGHVIDDDGKPLAGVRVRVLAPATAEANQARLISSAPEPVALATTETDEGGAFRIDTKRQPVVTLMLDAPGRAVRALEVADGENAGAFLLRAAPAKKGRVMAAGKPVAGAWVIVNASLFTRTDEQGHYTVPDLTGWGNSVLVIHPDFAIAEVRRTRESPPSLDVSLSTGAVARGRVTDPAGRPVANATVYAGSWPLATSAEDGSFTIAHLPADVKSISAREGKRIGAAKAGAETIVLRPGATITGTVRSTKDDTPVAGMRVSVPADPMVALSPTAFTDARGSFTLDAVQPGVPALALSHPSFNSGTSTITVAEGARVERALVATPVGRVSGTVVDEQKKPVSGAFVNALGASSYTAPDGSFNVRFATRDRASMLEVTKASYAGASHGPLRVEPGETKAGVRIVLPRGTKFEIKLVDAEGVAIAGEPVIITRRADPNAPAQGLPIQCADVTDVRGCRSNAEGKMSFSVAEGSYEIRAGGQATVEKRLRGQTLTAAESPLTIELERGAVVEGRVVWSDGSPVTIPVNVMTPGTFGPGTPVVDGGFTIRNVAAGKLVLAASAGPPTLMQGEPVEVTAPASGVVLKLPRFGRIEGRVLERDGQRPVKQFSVALETRGQNRFVGRQMGSRSFTADDGRFIMEDVAPGSIDVVVTAPGFVRGTTTAVEVPEAKAASVEVSLERAGSVVGRVTAGGRPVAGASVGVALSRGPGAESKQTDANGEYALDQLAPGSHELAIRKDGYVAKTITVNVEVGKDVRGDVELSRGRELQVRVVDSDGKPVALAEVRYQPGRPGRTDFFGSMRNTDGEGMLRFEALSDETYTITARKSGYAEGSVDVNPAIVQTATITLARGGSLSGRVTGLSPAELQFVDVSTMTTGRLGSPARATVDASGAFTIVGVPDGEVSVRAQQSVPPRRSVSSGSVKVVGGIGPFVELDFNAGFAIRGRVTRRGQIALGTIYFASTDRARPSANAEISPDGTYETRFSAAGDYRVMVAFHNSAGTMEAGKIDVRGDMTHDIEVRGAAIRGRVVDAATRAPIPDALVVLMSKEGRAGTDRPADSTGRFVFEFAGDGPHVLRAAKDGYGGEPREIVVQNGMDVEVELPLTRGELVVVYVVDASTGQNVDADVGFLQGAEPVNESGATRDASGAYRSWLRPGSYSVRVVTRGYAPKTVPLVVPGTSSIRIELTPIKLE